VKILTLRNGQGVVSAGNLWQSKRQQSKRSRCVNMF